MDRELVHTPSKFKQPIFVSDDDSTSTTEDYNMDSSEEQWDSHMEAVLRDEIRSWLATNGKILFGLESSKYLSRQSKLKKPV